MSLSGLLVSSTLSPWISILFVDNSMTLASIFLIPTEEVEAPVLAVAAMAAYVFVTFLVTTITANVLRRLGHSKDATPVSLHSVVSVNVDEKLSYDEIYAKNTRSATSKNIELQATIITESLLRKGGTNELSGFDFDKDVNFKININSRESALDQALIQNPLDSLKLSEDTRENIYISVHKQIDKIKTFYKGQNPTAITFYCAFPKNALGQHSKRITLTFSNIGYPIPLTWYVQALFDNKI